MMRMSSMSESVAAPQMQAGESSLTVNVSGEIEVE
jgi:predicted secreted protein